MSLEAVTRLHAYGPDVIERLIVKQSNEIIQFHTKQPSRSFFKNSPDCST